MIGRLNRVRVRNARKREASAHDDNLSPTSIVGVLIKRTNAKLLGRQEPFPSLPPAQSPFSKERERESERAADATTIQDCFFRLCIRNALPSAYQSADIALSLSASYPSDLQGIFSSFSKAMSSSSSSSSPPSSSSTNSGGNQAPTWVYDPIKDCSQGFCSMYCPQWCYRIFPPPPPFLFTIASGDNSDGGGRAISPFIITIIAVLAAAFLIVVYYIVVSKFCGAGARALGPFRRRNRSSGTGGTADRRVSAVHRAGDEELWEPAPSDGLDELLISKIAVCKYKRGDGFVDSTDCSVCLGEFHDGDSLRLLPKCSHAFHIPCIDTWLQSHSNCPLCRSTILSVAMLTSSSEPNQLPNPCDSHCDDEQLRGRPEMVVVIEESGEFGGCEDVPPPAHSRNEGSDRKVQTGIREEGDEMQQAQVSLADVLQGSVEDELLAAKEVRPSAGAGCSKDAGRNRSSVKRSTATSAGMSYPRGYPSAGKDSAPPV